jgi:sulfonate transport system ATP-binding protein
LSDPVIRVEHVSKSFAVDGGRSTLTVLDDIELQIEKGTFVSLVGPSGCGKTTLLKMMAGLTDYDRGVVSLRGLPVSGVPRNVGFVFQEPGLLPWRSVYRNVDLALESKGMGAAERRAAVERYLEMTGLSAFAEYPPYQLSGGMQQRVGLARALVGEPDVLFMDEPFGSLDALTRARLQEELASIVEKTTTTTVFVTHDVDEAVYLSDRVAVLSARPGRLQEVIDVKLERPRRRHEFRIDPAAALLRARILELIESQELVSESVIASPA